uniref:Uncharacterized protein n=1 Tax=Oryza glumipatula TaxID=40148 RepID=A0A0D9Y7X6_9ORYZ
MLSIKLPFLAILFALEENLSPRRPRALPYLVLPPPMEVEQVLSITSNSKVDNITNGDNVIIIPSVSTEEKEHINGAAETNHVAMIIAASMDRTDGDGKTTTEEETDGIAIARSASSNGSRQQDKKRGAFGLFRAMFMSFNGSASIKKRAAAAAATMGDQKKAEAAGGGAAAAVARSSSDVASWKNLVDGMRPLRLYGHLEYYPPPSPDRSEGMSMTSSYSSAQDLQELVNGHGKEDEEEEKNSPETEDGGCSPNPIEMQAEEFIAKFYEQFRLQKSDSFNNRAD